MKHSKNILKPDSFDHYKEYEYIIDRLVYLRKEFEINQGDLANSVGATQAAISVLERKLSFGFLVFKILMYLVDQFHINPNWVLIKDNDNLSKFTNIDEFSFSKKNVIHLKIIEDYKKFNKQVSKMANESSIILDKIQNL